MGRGKRKTKIDIDPKHFIRIIRKQFDLAKTQLKDCDEAFQALEKSLEIFEEKFDVNLAQNDPELLMKIYISALAESEDWDTNITVQYLKILAFYRKNDQQKPIDSKLKTLLDVLGRNISLLENEEQVEKINYRKKCEKYIER